MLKLEPAKMTKAIERAKREHLKVRIINAGNREYAVGVYTVRFVVANGMKLGECNCRGAQAGFYCKHLAAGAQANVMVQAFREHGAAPEPTFEESIDFLARNVGWCI